jgi:hypothetical protein
MHAFTVCCVFSASIPIDIVTTGSVQASILIHS